MLSVDSIQDTISLSANGRFQIPDYKLRGVYPQGTDATITFTDQAGAVYATFDGEVTNVGVSFLEEPDAVKGIPAGANFQILVAAPGEDPLAIRYGTVIRQEPRFPLAEVVQPEDVAKLYTANFAGSYIGPMWVPMGGNGTLSIHDNSAQSLPPSFGPDFGILTTTATRWLYPMNMDSVTINLDLLQVGTGAFNYGVLNVIVCSDYAMSSYIGAQFYVDFTPSNSRVQAITGTGPTTVVLRGSPISNQFAKQGSYQVKYDAMANTIAVYKGANLAPILTWQDTQNNALHGPGFRYVGLAWQNALFNPTLEPTAWEARDGV